MIDLTTHYALQSRKNNKLTSDFGHDFDTRTRERIVRVPIESEEVEEEES